MGVGTASVSPCSGILNAGCGLVERDEITEYPCGVSEQRTLSAENVVFAGNTSSGRTHTSWGAPCTRREQALAQTHARSGLRFLQAFTLADGFL